VVRQQVVVEIRQSKSEEDRRAEALAEGDIRRYWQREEEKRRAPRGSNTPERTACPTFYDAFELIGF
jgi:hypothetical protein